MSKVKNDFEMRYYGLLHALKDVAPELKKIRDVYVNSQKLDEFIALIDHEVSKKYGRV